MRALQGDAASCSSLRDVDAVVLCLPRPSDVIELVSHWTDPLPKVVIDTTTGSPTLSRLLHEQLAAKGVRYVDAPVSGSDQQAARGELTVMIGATAGSDAVVDRFVQTIGGNACYFGAVGGGNEAKLLNQALHLGIVGMLAETFATAEALQLDVKTVVQMLRTSSGGSRMLDRFGDSIAVGNFEPHFTLELACKDLGLAAEVSARTGAPSRYAELTRSVYQEALARGLGDRNFTVVCQRTEGRDALPH